jgi:diguanylate cyclase (GGDEF)-like protein
MATIRDDDDTVEAQSLSTSLDPYGQLIKMLMPRALCIAIYDRMSMPLWLSDGCDGPDLLQLVEEALNSARSGEPDPEEREGFARSWDGDTAYVFILRDGALLLGAVAISSRDSSSGSRPFSLMLGLLRPALQVLCRELSNQCNIGDLQKNLTARDGDFALLLNASGTSDEIHSDDFNRLVHSCVKHLDCSLGVLLVPDKKITVAYSINATDRRCDTEALESVQRHLLAWAQVQRRTLTLNKAPPSGPLGAIPYKILACPIQQGVQPVVGILALFKPVTAPDFDMRQVRIVEMMARRIAYVLQNAYDPATGLLTHPAFEQRALATLLAAGTTTSRHCVAYGDVDRLHVVNENHGMHVGDELLERIAEAIRTNLPAGIIGSHICGDRFALFFPEATLESAGQFLEALGRKIANVDYSHDGKRIEPSMSFGLAVIPDTKLPLSHALAAAEAACKAAKDLGRGRVEVYQSVDRSSASSAASVSSAPRHDDAAIVDSIRKAIADDRFRMEAQPIVQLGSSTAPRRFELLLRMIDPSGDNIAPDKFLNAAERHQMATQIDRWVLQYALEILSSAAPALQSLGAHFAINLSGQSVVDENFPLFLQDKLREYGLPPSLLSFEIAETAAVTNIVRAETLIRRLQDLGHDIALDDFGRGLSSLTYLKSLPVSGLKIDGGLVRDLAGNSRSQAAVTEIAQLARTMNLKTTAKCVESEAILAAVSQLGLDYGQGFAIGRPQSLEVVLQELLRGAAGVSRVSGSPMMSRLAG